MGFFEELLCVRGELNTFQGPAWLLWLTLILFLLIPLGAFIIQKRHTHDIFQILFVSMLFMLFYTAQNYCL